MAVLGDSLFLSRQLFIKQRSVLLKNHSHGVSIRTPRICLNVRFRSRIQAQSTLQVDLEEAKASRTSLTTEGVLSFDVVSEGELREKGFMGLRKTKLVFTIGPACNTLEQLEKLALGWMNIARLNMCHNTREWHLNVIRNIKNAGVN